jgi:hypothetical protein
MNTYNNSNVLNNNKNIYSIGTVSYIVIVIYSFFSSQLPDGNYQDFNNYLELSDNSLINLINNWEIGILRLLSNEPLWLLLNIVLRFFFDSEYVIRIIIFISATLVSWNLFRNYPNHFILIILILLYPLVIKNFLIHCRQGLGIAIFICGWFAVNRNIRILFLAMTPFIHVSFFIIIFLLFFSRLVYLLRLNIHLKFLLFLLVGTLIGVSIETVGGVLDARQIQDYEFEQTANVSGLGFLFWTVIAGIMTTSNKRWINNHLFEIFLVLTYLATYWSIEIAPRIFESGVILVLLAGLGLNTFRLKVFFTLILISAIFGWISIPVSV